MSKCSFCRNEPAENEHQYEGDFVFVMCDDCNARYEENKQLGPKFLICKCDPNNPKELDLAMGKEELETAKKQIVQDRSGLNKEEVDRLDDRAEKLKIIRENSGYISKDEKPKTVLESAYIKEEFKDENDNTKTKRKKMFGL